MNLDTHHDILLSSVVFADAIAATMTAHCAPRPDLLTALWIWTAPTPIFDSSRRSVDRVCLQTVSFWNPTIVYLVGAPADESCCNVVLSLFPPRPKCCRFMNGLCQIIGALLNSLSYSYRLSLCYCCCFLNSVTFL